jgi:hypothetical protein
MICIIEGDMENENKKPLPVLPEGARTSNLD